MRALRWLQPVIALALLAGVAADVSAQDKLPAAMAGNWNGTVPSKGTPFGGTWSIVIDKQNPDGSIEGKANWVGTVCVMDSEPMTGLFDGTQLSIQVQLRDKMPNARCPKVNIVLKKTGAGNEFEGEIPGSASRYRLTLKPS